MKVSIVYWSGTGNTEAMANLIKEGAESTGAEVSIKQVGDVSDTDVLNADVAFLGCPSMGDEALEDTEFEPFIAKIESSLSGKKLGLFGSYGWGSGQWMDTWTERMRTAGAVMVGESLIVNEAPSGNDIDKCKNFGKLCG
ncbi:MAG: flavodoxin [Planctomycetaceae bacterium]|jgi:flavodoxin short chain|nr:flavodoxin [Planctomycetaceae bacterium]